MSQARMRRANRHAACMQDMIAGCKAMVVFCGCDGSCAATYTAQERGARRTRVDDEGLVLREILADRAHHDHGDDAGHDDHDHARVQDAEPVHLRTAELAA